MSRVAMYEWSSELRLQMKTQVGLKVLVSICEIIYHLRLNTKFDSGTLFSGLKIFIFSTVICMYIGLLILL